MALSTATASPIVSSTSIGGWMPVICGGCNSFDPASDAQQGQGEVEIVGSSTYVNGMIVQGNEPAFMMAFIADPSNPLTAGELAFRVRLDDDRPGNGAFNAVFSVGIDVNSDGRLDLLVSVNGTSPSGPVIVYNFPGGTNGPSDITYGTQFGSTIATTANNYAFRAATAADAVNGNGILDVGGNGRTDYLLSFSVDFSTFRNALGTAGYNVNASTAMRFIAFTSINTSNINGDYAGCSPTATTFEACFTPAIPVNIPEPATSAMTVAGLGTFIVWFRRRRANG